jgi:hypothetical protein
MKRILSLIGVCIIILLVAGCMSPAPPSGSTTGPTVPLTLAPYLNPQPTSVVPPSYSVSIQIQKNTIPTNPWISVVYEGEAGLVLPSEVEAKVIRSDGTIEQESARNPPKGTQLLFNGTTRTDRVIVNVTYIDGSAYTVRDELVPFQNINPI